MFPLTSNFVTNTVHSTLSYTIAFRNDTQYGPETTSMQTNYGFTNDDVIHVRSNTTFDSASNTFDGNYTLSNHNDTYAEYAEIPYYIKATSMTFCIVIMCLGVIGNVMVPIVILKTKDMRNSTNIFLVNLSIADLMVLLVCTPTVLVEVNSKPETWVLGKELCLAVPFVELTVAHASVLTILAISFERYYAICEPLRAGYVCTKTRAALICALAWFFAALFTSPVLVIAEHRTVEKMDGRSYTQCLTQAVTHWQITFFVFVITVLFIIPLVILIVLYSIIAKNLLSAASKVVMNKTLDPSNTRARKQVIMMLGTVVLSFFLCLMPYRILALWIIITPLEDIQDVSPEKWYNFLYFSRIMLYINSAVNPILYNLMSSKFRVGFCKILVCYRNREVQNENKIVHRKRAGTLTTGSTTSSSLSRTTNSLKKLFHRNSLEKNNVKSDTDTEVREDCLQNIDTPNNSLYDRYMKKRYLRQQSAPVCETGNGKSNKINRMRSEGDMYQIPNNKYQNDLSHDTIDCDQAFIVHNDSKAVSDKSRGSLRRNVLINTVKSKSVEDDVYQKVEVDFVFACKNSLDVCEFPESYV